MAEQVQWAMMKPPQQTWPQRVSKRAGETAVLRGFDALCYAQLSMWNHYPDCEWETTWCLETGKERPEGWDEIKTLGWPKGRRALSWRAEFSLRVLVVSWNSISTMQAWVDVDCCTRGEWRQRRSNSVSTNGDVQASHWKWGHDKDHRQCSHEPAARRRYA